MNRLEIRDRRSWSAVAFAAVLLSTGAVMAAEPPLSAAAAIAQFDAAIEKMRGEFAAVTGDASDKEWVIKKLQHMVDRDQFARKLMIQPQANTEYVQQLMQRLLALDRQNTDDLKELLKKYSWFTISQFGKKADGNAWLLVQHADHDPEFQQEVLAKLEKLYPAGETRPANYAYLYDRLAASWHDPTKRRLQRFGTQGQCTGPGKWEPLPMEEPERVDERRASVGLPPLKEYIAGFQDVCK
jgi:hypothetical protein